MRRIHQHKEHERPDHAQHRARQIHRFTADLVGQRAAQRHGNCIQRRAQHGGRQRHGSGQMQHRRHVGQREHDDQRIQHVRTDARTARDQQLTPVLAQHLFDGRAGRLALFFHFAEHRRFLDAAAQPQAEHYQRHAGDERNAPAPGLEVLGADKGRHQGDEAGADQRAARRADLREGRVAAALVRLAVATPCTKRSATSATGAHTPHEA
ncbi:hypothetical protein G6F31_017283 [Rhizopus arrhizus]|nr:hypothetical protein G6F31_017283 [Rhizopus arrhizus]